MNDRGGAAHRLPLPLPCTATAEVLLQVSGNDEVPLVDKEEWSDQEDDSSASSVEADGEDDTIQLLAAVRESDTMKWRNFLIFLILTICLMMQC